MVNKDNLKDFVLEHFEGVKIKITNGSEELIPKTNIIKINPKIYKINSITVLYYDGNYFKDKKDAITRLRSGQHLMIKNYILYSESFNHPVLTFSKKYRERIAGLERMNYYPYQAKVRYIVAWQGKEDTQENAILLPDVYFKRKSLLDV